jgi:HEPN domain-containing protein
MDKWLRESVRRMQGVADEDLGAARLCLGVRPPFVRTVVFHCQQAVEKHLKAWLLALGELDFPHTHSLPELAEHIARRGGPRLTHEPLEFLTQFAVAARYALAHVSLPEAEEALAEAERLVETARQAVAQLAERDDSPQVADDDS